MTKSEKLMVKQKRVTARQYQHLAFIIQRYRTMQGLKIKDLNIALGYEIYGMVHAMECARVPVPPYQIKKLASALNINSETIIDALVKDYRQNIISEMEATS